MSPTCGILRALQSVVLATMLAGTAAPVHAERAADWSHSGRIEFGIWVQSAAGEIRFVATGEVPCVAGQAFGWRVRNARPDRPTKWVERIGLPATPPSWEGVKDDPSVTVSADGKSATTAGESWPGQVFTGHVWYISAGDPTGEYRMSVEFENGKQATFRFRVVAPKDRRESPAAGEVI